jgi:hypothetical protein
VGRTEGTPEVRDITGAAHAVPAMKMNPFVRFANWILEPAIFLLVRLLGDFAAAVYLLVVRDYLAGVWFALVGVATLVSDVKASKRRRAEAA